MLAMVGQLDVATRLWDHAAMTEEEVVTRLKEAAAAKKAADERAKELAKEAGDALEDVVVEALTGGMKPAKVAEVTGYHYETIRRIARARNLQRLREPTVTSRKKAQPGDDSPA